MHKAVQSAALIANDAFGKMQHFMAPYILQAQSFADNHAAPAMHRVQPLMQQAQARIQKGFQHSTASIDASLHGLQPWKVAAVTAVVVLLTLWALTWLQAAFAEVRETGMDNVLCCVLLLTAHGPALADLRTLFCCLSLAGCSSKLSAPCNAGFVQSLIDFLKTLPGIRGLVEREHTKMMVQISKPPPSYRWHMLYLQGKMLWMWR